MSMPNPPPAPGSTPWTPTQIVRPRATSGNALPVGTRLAEFELLEVLGEGGFGIVYLAQDHMLQRRVAIKEYMPASLSRRTGDGLVVAGDERQRAVFFAGLNGFVNEARLLAQFDHPALVKVHRFWQGNGTAYMVMPYYEGTTLKQVLKTRGEPPEEPWLKALLRELTGALDEIHRAHCVHRDIAPDNILILAESGKPLLLDFGAARQVIGDATQALTAILKPGYAPLEQYAELPDLRQGPWTDVYALCAVLHLAITGQKPPPAVGRKVLDEYRSLTRLAGGRYSLALLQGVDAGLRLLPDQRPQSMALLRQALGIEGTGGPSQPSPADAKTRDDPALGESAVRTTMGAPDIELPAVDLALDLPAPPATLSGAAPRPASPPARTKPPTVPTAGTTAVRASGRSGEKAQQEAVGSGRRSKGAWLVGVVAALALAALAYFARRG